MGAGRVTASVARYAMHTSIEKLSVYSIETLLQSTNATDIAYNCLGERSMRKMPSNYSCIVTDRHIHTSLIQKTDSDYLAIIYSV